MFDRFNRGLLTAAIVLFTVSGCAPPPVAPPPPGPVSKNASTVWRVITEGDLLKIERSDPVLDVPRCVEILARLNGKDPVYIRGDISGHKPLIVPEDFSHYKDWSPLPRDIPQIRGFQRFILVVKNIPFLGWYENGRLAGDTYIGIGKKNNWTRAGFYRVDRKDPVHWSTYPDAYGDRAVMPDALHIYARVWIHLGDVVGPYCSHGCINVPMGYSGKLWDWADVGAPVLVTQSLKALGGDLRTALRNKRIMYKRKAGKTAHKKKIKV